MFSKNLFSVRIGFPRMRQVVNERGGGGGGIEPSLADSSYYCLLCRLLVVQVLSMGVNKDMCCFRVVRMFPKKYLPEDKMRQRVCQVLAPHWIPHCTMHSTR